MSSRKHGVLSDTPGVFWEQGGGGVESARNNETEKPCCRKIELGWLHLSNNEYRQVRTENGATRQTTVEKRTTVRQILEMGKELFLHRWDLKQKDQLMTVLLRFVILKGIKSIQHILLVDSMSKLNWSCSDFAFAPKKNHPYHSAHLKRMNVMKSHLMSASAL